MVIQLDYQCALHVGSKYPEPLSRAAEGIWVVETMIGQYMEGKGLGFGRIKF